MIDFSFFDLYTAYLDCLKHKKNTENAFKFSIDANQNLYKLYKELITNKYEIGRSICFIVTHPKLREVFAADFRDRIVHHLVINKILPYLEKYSFIDNSYSCRVGKGTLYGIKSVDKMIKECSCNYTEKCYILKCDLKSFFMTIDKRLLFYKLIDFIKQYEIFKEEETFNFYIGLIEKIIFNCPQNNCFKKGNLSLWIDLPKDKSLFHCDEFHGLPIGNLTSQIFANFFLSEFDHYITNKFTYYGRYVDDFVIISNDKKSLINEIPLIKKFLKENLNVTLHPKKIYLQECTKGVTFIGGIIKPNRIYIINRTKGKFFAKLNHYYNKKDNLTLNDLKDIRATVNSYLGLFRQFNSYRIRKKILTKNEFLFLYKFFINHNFKKLSLKKDYKKLLRENFLY